MPVQIAGVKVKMAANAVADVGGPGPVIRHCVAEQVKKGEDFYLVDAAFKAGDVTCGLYCVFDGHNGVAAPKWTKNWLMKFVCEHLPKAADYDTWLESLPAALGEGFLECHNSFAIQGQESGTTVTVVIVSGWTVTVAAVGDSRAILDTVAGGVTSLSVDHRFEVNPEEQKRVLKEGGQLGRLKTFDGVELGPLRSWPGGLCVSRSVGDVDCGPFISPLPHVRQLVVPRAGGRIVIASDGLWDAVESDRAAKCCRGMPAGTAASQLVKESIKSRGLRDDITVIVVDLLPSDIKPDVIKTTCPVPKASSTKSLWAKLKPKKKGEAAAVPEEAVTGSDGKEANERLPRVTKDKDSMHGGDLYQRYQNSAGGSVHSAGNFCSVCGQQVEGDDRGDVSIKAGKRFCSRHRASQ